LTISKNNNIIIVVVVVVAGFEFVEVKHSLKCIGKES